MLKCYLLTNEKLDFVRNVEMSHINSLTSARVKSECNVFQF